MDSSDEDLCFTIDVFKPETLPMERLAKYLSELAKLLGEPNHVHFTSVDEGSAILRKQVDPVAKAKISKRLSSFRDFAGASKAYDKLNDLLKEDGATGNLEGLQNVLLKFPGKNLDDETILKLPYEHISLRGELVKIGGTDNTVPVEIRDASSGKVVRGSTVNKEIAKRLAACLFTPIEVSGIGQWHETAKDGWKLMGFKIQDFTKLDALSATALLKELQKLPPERPHDPQIALKAMREDDQ